MLVGAGGGCGQRASQRQILVEQAEYRISFDRTWSQKAASALLKGTRKTFAIFPLEV